MKRFRVVLMLLFLPGLASSSWGFCPQDPYDRGECDTIYVEPWPADTLLKGDAPWLARVPIYLSFDVVNDVDSIEAFIIPLCYSRTNPSKYCSVSAYWNTTSMLWARPDFSARSVFRHITQGTDTLHHNRLADMAADLSGREWNFAALRLESDSAWMVHNGGTDSAYLPPHFFLASAATGPEDQEWWEGTRVLVATMTFKVEDTMTICMDTCWWPPTSGLQLWIRDEWGSPQMKVPRWGNGTAGDYATIKYVQAWFLRGDSNGDGVIDLADAVYLLNYLFKAGPEPDPYLAGDADCDGVVNLDDVIHLLNYLFKNGPPPCEP
jgi:hypothetical protein